MIDIKDFIEIYYVKSEEDMTLAQFEAWKKYNHYDEWDYPLEEYEHIASMPDVKVVPVRFKDYTHGYDYRFCEIPVESI